MIEYFLDADEQNRFRVKGLNGEIVATSEPYYSQSNAERGVRGLYLILHADLGGIVDKEEIRSLTTNKPDSGSSDDDGSSGSGDVAESGDEAEVQKAAEAAPLSGGSSKGTEELGGAPKGNDGRDSAEDRD